jgi:hypothetical protein
MLGSLLPHYNDPPGVGYSPVIWAKEKPRGEPVDADPRSGAKTQPAPGVGRILACWICRHPTTRPADLISVSGHHSHTFTNPSGLRFHIACFSRAPGARGEGPTTDYFTWFPGYGWQGAHCAACHEHLGWRFTSPHHEFFGLIWARLVEIEE